MESLTRFIPELLSAIHVEALIYGNTTRFEADQLADNVVEHLKAVRPMRPLFARELMLNREHQLQSGKC